MQETFDPAATRPLNVSLLAGSKAHRAYYDRTGSSVSELTADQLAAGFPPRPSLNLHDFGGKTQRLAVYFGLAAIAIFHRQIGRLAQW